MKTKQLEKGLRQLTDEGVAQLFIMQPGNRKIIDNMGLLIEAGFGGGGLVRFGLTYKM